MFVKILLLTTVTLAAARPSDDLTIDSYQLWEASDLCTSERHWLLPHEWDCTRFYYCEYGMKYIEPRLCAPGTEFSYALQVCIHPIQANCQLPGVPPTEPATYTSSPTEIPSTQTESPTVPPTSPTTTTQAPTETTKAETHTSPTTTTQAPTETTKAETQASPTTTTQAPTETTKTEPQASPTTTTQAPTETTKAETHTSPTTTTQAPTETTKAETHTSPTTTTQAPTETTKAETHTSPTTTTQAPTETTKAETHTSPTTTTQAPTETTKAETHTSPTTTTQAPTETTKAETHTSPTTTTQAPTETTKAETHTSPTTTTQAPTETTKAETHTSPTTTTQAPTTKAETHTSPTTTPAPTDAPWVALPNGCPVDFTIHHLLPHKECNMFYYCVFGEKVERQCAPGTYFNYKIQVCDWPQNVECANSGWNGEETGSGENGENGTEILPNGCPADWSIHQLLPHELDCSKFYYCVYGNKVERDCAPGTHFNPTLQVCDWPANAGCANSGDNGVDGNENGSDGNGEDGNGSGEESGSGGNGENGSGNNNTETLPNGCPADWSIHKLLPHESKCSKFYYCVHGNKVERDCAPGTHFNPSLQVCDWPANAGCASSGDSGEDGNENGSGGNGEDGNENGSGGNGEESGSGENGENGSGNNNTETLPNGCPVDWSIHKLLPHESDCSKFYYCVHGNIVERDCAPGTHFNPTLQVCDWPANAGCANSGDNGEDGNGNGEESGSGGNGEDGNENGNGEESGSGENGDNGNGENGSGNNNTETLPNGCPADWSIHQLLPHKSNCSKFYYCVHGNLVERDCAPGTHFNPTQQVCDWPAHAGCAIEGGNGGENPGEDGSGNGNGEDGNESGENNGNGENGEDGNGHGELENDRCIDNCNVLPWAHSTDCDKYWHCDGGKTVLSVCSEGLHFNPSTFNCDFICNAGCVRDNTQATLSADGIKIFLPWDNFDRGLERLVELSMHERKHH